MYSDELGTKALALLAIIVHDTPLEDTHPDLARQVAGLLEQAEAEAYEFAAHMDATEPDAEIEHDTILVDDKPKADKTYRLRPDLMYRGTSKEPKHD